MRNDPDVILVDRLRDEETVEVAIQAALTGHMVLSAMNTDDASSTLSRLVTLGANPFAVTSTVRAVLAQRIVRKLNPDTKVMVETPAEVRQLFEQHEMEVPSQIYRVAEKSGYKGRTAFHELLVMSDEVKERVVQGASRTEIREASRKAGMRTLMEDGLAKVAAGITTVEEVLRVV